MAAPAISSRTWALWLESGALRAQGVGGQAAAVPSVELLHSYAGSQHSVNCCAGLHHCTAAAVLPA